MGKTKKRTLNKKLRGTKSTRRTKNKMRRGTKKMRRKRGGKYDATLDKISNRAQKKKDDEMYAREDEDLMRQEAPQREQEAMRQETMRQQEMQRIQAEEWQRAQARRQREVVNTDDTADLFRNYGVSGVDIRG